MRIPIFNNYGWRYTKIEQFNSYIPKTPKLQSKRFLVIILLCISGLVILINTVSIEQFKFSFVTNVGVTDGDGAFSETGVKKDVFLEISPDPEVKTPYLINTSGCRIPYLDPDDPHINERFIRENITITCDPEYLPRLVGSNDSAIFILHHIKSFYVDKKTEFECCWSSIIRVSNEDNEVTFNKTCNSFSDSANIDVDFVQVSCFKKTNPWYLIGFQRSVLIYLDYFSFVPRKREVEERCLNARGKVKSEDPPLSVLMVGVDSVSRVNLHRQMPKTLQALRDLEAIELLGYNKIAYNTYPNVVAVLSGQSEAELESECWKDHEKTFDDCDLIWKNFSSAGYRTIFGEDACSMTIFNYVKPGFQKPPTDYYLRPYCLAIENNIGNTYRSNANLCVGSVLNFENLLNYTRRVATRFPDDPYFAFFWQSSLTHDFFDYPRFGDDAYGEFLQYLKTDNLLRNTVLVFMSDHGIRWGSFRQTYQGKLEESLPFMFLSFPDWWKNKYPEAMQNLRDNTLKLTTPFDLHETLRDILSPSSMDTSSKASSRGISWFSPVPESRTCEVAGIPEHYCTCHKIRNISLSDPRVVKKVNFLVDEINGMLLKYPQCAKLKLNRVIDAKYWKTNADHSKKVWYDYTITLETVPGKAIFEGTVRYAKKEKPTVLGSVSRLNAYGNSSACVNDFNLRLYCYCL